MWVHLFRLYLCLHAFTPTHCLKPTLCLLLTFALLEVRMHKLQRRVLCCHLTRYLIIISQTITGLIVIGEILERREEKCQVYWQGIFILWLVFLSLHFDLVPHTSSDCRSNTNTNSLRYHPKRQTRICICRRGSVELICDRSPKRRRKGVKGHLKANVNGKAFRVSALCFTKRGQARNCKADKCGCLRRVTQFSVK